MNNLRYTVQKLRDLARAQAYNKFILTSRRHCSVQLLKEHQERRLRKLLKFAIKKSPFYRDHLQGVVPGVTPLMELPILTKDLMLTHYDELVTDRRLKLKELEAYLNQLQTDEYHPLGYKIFRSGGSTGNAMVMAYNAPEFSSVLAQILRSSKGQVKMRWGRRLKAANIYARTPTHDSVRISQSFQIGLHRVEDFPVDMPIDELIQKLNAFEPDVLNGYPSIIAELAHAKGERRLMIAPQAIFLGSEPLTFEMRQAIVRAFGIEPNDHYGTTEAIILSCECPDHRGMHLEDDMHIIEVVDRHNQPVRYGQPGHKILVTNLYAYTQPIIRYEVTDMLVIDDRNPGPCTCGTNMRLLTSVMGRNEDLFHFSNTRGEEVVITHEDLRSAMAKCQNVRQYQIVQKSDGIQINAVLINHSIENHTRDQIIKVISALLQKADVKVGQIACTFVSTLERNPLASQKFRQILSTVDGLS